MENRTRIYAGLADSKLHLFGESESKPRLFKNLAAAEQYANRYLMKNEGDVIYMPTNVRITVLKP